MKKLLELAQKKGYKVYHVRILSDHPEYTAETSRRKDAVQEMALLQDWLIEQLYFVQSIIIVQLEIEKGWGYELTYWNGTDWNNTTEDYSRHSYFEALQAGLEHAVKLLHEKD